MARMRILVAMVMRIVAVLRSCGKLNEVFSKGCLPLNIALFLLVGPVAHFELTIPGNATS